MNSEFGLLSFGLIALGLFVWCYARCKSFTSRGTVTCDCGAKRLRNVVLLGDTAAQVCADLRAMCPHCNPSRERAADFSPRGRPRKQPSSIRNQQETA